ncbi:MAG: aspartate kinase [bacterium]
MALVVQKYGGSSLATVDLIKKVASKALARHKKGDRVVVVASAMKGETDGLIKKALDITDLPDLREYDSMVSTGEQVSTALLAIAINAMGGKARSMLSFQLPLCTDSSFKDARIEKIETGRIKKLLDEGHIVVVAGFQGVDADNNITTLGRGGSDTSAVALAAALQADVIEICSDVDGIYTTDPGIVENARRLDRISYEEVLELSSLGAKVLQIRAVEMAMKNEIPVLCLSTFSPTGGTLVTKGDEQMEQIVVSGVALDKDECKVTIQNVPDRPGVAANVFKPLSDANISVDMIIQNVSEAGYTDISFTVRKEDLPRARELAKEASRKLEAEGVVTDDKVVKVSVVGLGMRSHAGVASRMFEALSAGNVNIQMISTSEIKVSCVVDKKYGELAVRLLHDEFELHKKSGGKKSSKKTAGKTGSSKKKTAKKASASKKK